MTRRQAGRDRAQAQQPDLFAPAAPASTPASESPRAAPASLPPLPAVPPELWERLAYSRFRARFHLGAKEREYLATRGLPEVMTHAADFIATRLAPAHPEKDGRQTPWRGHPVFIAQHATGTCCRGCVAKWHAMPAGQPLDATQQAYILSVIQEWIRRDATATPQSAPRPDPR
ncbi:hypothetical protein AA11826_1923 [Komagataeibacter oboediens DSM 11826]|uniref:DUF4186 domain-containing protein n=1 Tax=Komagataeibacter oboediens TaxID=65958 RepID=A0A318QW64_9PROT|nr:DUF4186 domain-containing protein [Komagataeibacter oboediens]PYD83345.1 DUF4186 domain-containing protein [Komagataeibacter oboediens]GBR38976.1 hypothetical protein AA11826_1923 [Komagataeibacter oboediens DSM 11826]